MRRPAVLLLVPLVVLGTACGGDDDDSASGDFCDRATLVEQRFNALDEEFGGDEIPSAEALEEAADAIADLADGAPSAVKADLETVADGVGEVADIFGEIDFDDPDALSDPANAETIQAMGERIEALDADMTDASDRVEAYLKDECGLDISDE